MFPTKNDLKDQNATLTAQLETAETENETLTNSLNDSQAEIVTKDETIATMTAELGDVNESNETLAASNATLTTELEASKVETTEADASAQAKAIDIAAAAGHEPNINPESDSEASGDLYAQYCELKKTSPEKAGAFWILNKEAIKASA